MYIFVLFFFLNPKLPLQKALGKIQATNDAITRRRQEQLEGFTEIKKRKRKKKKKKSIKSITLGTARDSITAVRALIK